MSGFLYRTGRLLQLAGMIVLPIAVAGNLAPRDGNGLPLLSLGTSLMMSGVGVVVFLVGYWLQQASRQG